MIVDFHTHDPASRFPALLSAGSFNAGPLVSLEFHPWKLPERFTTLPENFLPSLSLFAALGEIGLDRLRGPMLPVQQQWLRALLAAAGAAEKPVVIHCVRAFPELFSALKEFPGKVMIHGFRGKAELLTELWRRGFVVSFHPAALDDPALVAAMKQNGGPFGFESDDDRGIDLERVMHRAAEVLGRDDLEDFCASVFMEFLNDKR